MSSATTKKRLVALVEAVLDVRADPEAARLLKEQLDTTRDGTGVDAEDLQHIVTTALAHWYAEREHDERKAVAHA